MDYEFLWSFWKHLDETFLSKVISHLFLSLIDFSSQGRSNILSGVFFQQLTLPINISEKRHSNYSRKLWRGHGQASVLFCNWAAHDWIKIRLDYSGWLRPKLVGCERRHSTVYSTAGEVGFTRIHNDWDTTRCNSRTAYHCQLGKTILHCCFDRN